MTAVIVLPAGNVSVTENVTGLLRLSISFRTAIDHVTVFPTTTALGDTVFVTRTRRSLSGRPSLSESVSR